MKVIDYKKVDINNIVYHEPVKTAGGCLISRTYYQHLEQEIPIYIQTPKLKVNSDLEILDSKTYLELELDKRHINFYEFINNIDDKNIGKTFSRSEDWFQEKLPMDVVDDFYKTNIKMRKYNKSPIIKFKIPIYKKNSRKSCDIFGDDLKPIDVDEIKKNTEVICILELEGIKFFKQRFETEWKVVQLRAYLNKKNKQPCLINESFLSDHESEDESTSIPTENPNSAKDSTIVKNIEISINKKNEPNQGVVKVEKLNEVIENTQPLPKIANNEELELEMDVKEVVLENKTVDVDKSNLTSEIDLENTPNIENIKLDLDLPDSKLENENESHNINTVETEIINLQPSESEAQVNNENHEQKEDAKNIKINLNEDSNKLVEKEENLDNSAESIFNNEYDKETLNETVNETVNDSVND